MTSLLLKFRYDDMKHAFEGVRNNVEVGECWITLAQELTRLSGKPFDSHQCQSKVCPIIVTRVVLDLLWTTYSMSVVVYMCTLVA